MHFDQLPDEVLCLIFKQLTVRESFAAAVTRELREFFKRNILRLNFSWHVEPDQVQELISTCARVTSVSCFSLRFCDHSALCRFFDICANVTSFTLSGPFQLDKIDMAGGDPPVWASLRQLRVIPTDTHASKSFWSRYTQLQQFLHPLLRCTPLLEHLECRGDWTQQQRFHKLAEYCPNLKTLILPSVYHNYEYRLHELTQLEHFDMRLNGNLHRASAIHYEPLLRSCTKLRVLILRTVTEEQGYDQPVELGDIIPPLLTTLHVPFAVTAPSLAQLHHLTDLQCANTIALFESSPEVLLNLHVLRLWEVPLTFSLNGFQKLRDLFIECFPEKSVVSCLHDLRTLCPQLESLRVNCAIGRVDFYTILGAVPPTLTRFRVECVNHNDIDNPITPPTTTNNITCFEGEVDVRERSPDQSWLFCMPKLQTLKFHGSNSWPLAALDLTRAFASLTSLNCRSHDVKESDIAVLARNGVLQECILVNTTLSEKTIMLLARRCPRLQILHCTVPRLTEASFAVLLQARSLHTLRLRILVEAAPDLLQMAVDARPAWRDLTIDRFRDYQKWIVPLCEALVHLRHLRCGGGWDLHNAVRPSVMLY